MRKLIYVVKSLFKYMEVTQIKTKTRRHLATALEGLGRADYEPRGTLEDLFDRALSRANLGRGHIFITPVKNDFHPELLEKLRATTGEAALCVAADEV